MNLRLKLLFINNNIKQVEFSKRIGIQNSLLSTIIGEQARVTVVNKYKSKIIRGFKELGINVTKNDIWPDDENDEVDEEVSELEEPFLS
jgi:hypothetical protein